jgi:hypothetical protein
MNMKEGIHLRNFNAKQHSIEESPLKVIPTVLQSGLPQCENSEQCKHICKINVTLANTLNTDQI